MFEAVNRVNRDYSEIEKTLGILFPEIDRNKSILGFLSWIKTLPIGYDEAFRLIKAGNLDFLKFIPRYLK